jgi:subtilase family serine protease
MRRRLRFCRWSFPLLLAGLFTGGIYTSRAQEIAASASSQDAAGQRLERMILLLQPSAKQQSDLDSLLAAQQTRGNAQFHKFLTPAEFASKYAVSAADAAAVTAWLKAQGFEIAPLPAGRGWIEFSGTVAQTQKAFGGKIEGVADAGAVRYRVSGAISLPATIAATVKGLVSLDGSQAAAAFTTPVELSKSNPKVTAAALAAETSLATASAMTPSLAASWLQLSSLEKDGISGAGETIAIAARSNVRSEDFAAFRKAFGLPESQLSVHLTGSDQESSKTDPARTSEEPAVIQAISWAGATAPEAQILLVPAASTNATDGLDLALAATIDGALARTVSVGYSVCEASLSATHQDFYAALYRQAAAEGIAIVAASGDSGGAACHLSGDNSAVSTGLAVNGLASTPWNTAVGSVAFSSDASSLSGWQPATSTDAAYATGGGFSRSYATPGWQFASGLPASDPGTAAGHHRYLPDISLPTAANSLGSRGLAFCYAGESASGDCHLMSAGGSGTSAAIFSGIAALLAQKYGPQGNLAPNLYALRQSETSASQASAAFSDITTGGAKLGCAVGSPDCQVSGNDTGEIGYESAAGYDLATGLGSINAKTLVENWATAHDVGTAPATVQMTTATGTTYNPSATIILSAKVISGSGSTVPTGTVQFFDETTNANTGTPVTLAADGTASYSEQGQFTAGGHNIQAQYSGDDTYEAANSQPVTINVQPSPTTLTIVPNTTAPISGGTVTVTGTVTATNPGSTNLGADAPTGTVTVNLDGVAAGSALLTTTAGVTSASVTVTAPASGSHAIQGVYAGDTNYNASTSPSVTLVVAKAASVTTLSATPGVITNGVAEVFTATVAAASATATAIPGGSVSFFDNNTTLLGTVAVSSGTAILTTSSLSGAAAHSVTAIFSGDANFTASTSSAVVFVSNLLPVTVTLVESSSVLTPNAPVTLTATVTPVTAPPATSEQNPSGFVLFFANDILISGQVPVLQGAGDTGVASTTVPHILAGQYIITARYSGDPTFAPGVSNGLTLNAEDFKISCDSTNITMTQGSTQSVNCAVASLGGLAGPIQVVCNEQNAPALGAIACSFSPGTVNSTGSTVLTVITTKGNVSRNAQPPKPGQSPWAATAGLTLAFAGLLLSPIGRRARWVRGRGGKLLSMAILLAGLVGAGLGCSNTVTITNNNGTPLGTHTLQITAGAEVNTVTVTHNAYLTVTVTP